MPRGARGRSFGRSGSACGRHVHDGVALGGDCRSARRGRRSSNGGVGLRRGSRRWRRWKRVRESGVLNKRRNTRRELHNRGRSLRLRQCDRSKDAFDVVHARDRLGEVFKPRSRRRRGSQRAKGAGRCRAAATGSSGRSLGGGHQPQRRAGGWLAWVRQSQRENSMSMSFVPTSVPHSKLTSTTMSSIE